MCGLVGMIGDLDKEDRTMFRQMLVVDALRGHHSTGVAMATAKQETSVFKKALNPVDLMQLRGFDDVVAWDAQVLIGHNRYATVGKINNQTAHPFEHMGVIGAHNGTLQNWFHLDESKDFDVDSECLLYNIAKHGFAKPVKHLRGAWALTVYDQNTHEFHMLRNKERPLFFGYKEDQSVMYWASEPWMIRDMAARCGVKLDKNLIQPKENHLLTWKVPKGVKAGKLGQPEVTKLEVTPEKKQSPVTVTYQHRPPHQPQSGNLNTSRPNGGFSSSTNRGRSGFVTGQHIAFCPVAISTSPNTQASFLEGVQLESPWMTVRVYGGSPEEQQAQLDCHHEVTGEIVAVVDNTVNVEPYVVVQRGSLKFGASFTEDDLKLLEEEALDEDDLNVLAPGPNGRLIDEKEWEKLTKHGCGYCSCNLTFELDVHWREDTPICVACHMDNKGN